MRIKVSANLRPWAAMRVLAGDIEELAELLHILEDEGIKVVTRYGEGADALPDPSTMCPGDCEGTGVVPINEGILLEDASDKGGDCVDVAYSPEDIALYRTLWEAAEAEHPSEDGWHFVKCPVCNGTGKRIDPKQAIQEAVGEASMAWQGGPSGVFDDKAANVAADRLARRLGLMSLRAGKKTLVFDFDGTIAEELEFPDIGAPRHGIIELMRKAKDAGIEIVIQSCRWSEHDLSTPESAAEQMEAAKAWLQDHDVPYDRLVAGKPLGEGYVDDKAIGANDLQALDALINRIASQHPVDGSLKISAFVDQHEWGCLMLEFPADMSKKIQAWGKANIPDDVLYLDPEHPKEYGRENHTHATVSYGVSPKTPADDVRAIVDDFGSPLKVRLGKVSKFAKDNMDVIKIDVESQDMHDLHADIEDEVGTPGNTYPDYQPHVTVAYVKPGSCDHLLGQEPFKDVELELSEFDYGCPTLEGGKDVHIHFDLLESEVAASMEPSIKNLRNAFMASGFSDLQKSALRLVENDPAWQAMLDDPASAQALGNLQQALRDARSNAELQLAWESHMDLPWDVVEEEAEKSA